MSVMLGIPAAGSPWSRADAALEARKPLSVLTTSTDAKPVPSGVVRRNGTVIEVAP